MAKQLKNDVVLAGLMVAAMLALTGRAEAEAGADEPVSGPERTRVEKPRRWLLRGALGVGYLNASNELSAGEESLDVGIKGVALALRGEMQGRIANGLFLGGALGLTRVDEPTVSLRGVEAEAKDTALLAWSLGPVLTYYFAGDRGLHLSAFAGLMALKATSGDDAESSETELGPSLGGTLGYDFAVSRDGTLGAQLQLLWGTTSDESGGVQSTSNVVTPVLSFSGTFGGPKQR
jgi:hypothetical protein